MHNTTLLDAAWAVARRIEEAASAEGVSYGAAQTYYGVEVEALVGDEWVRARDLKDGVEVEAVRLFDCDGVRGETCRTVEEIEAEVARWVGWPDHP